MDFSIQNPFVLFTRDQSELWDSSVPDFVEISLDIDDGLYSLSLEPVTPSDPRFYDLPTYHVTPSGDFCPLNRSMSAGAEAASLVSGIGVPVWTTEVLSSPPLLGRVLALNASLDFDDELRIFSDEFLAPAAIPPARRHYDIGTSSDMTELSIRFMGAGTDRIIHTVGISNGLEKPPSKVASRVPPKLFPQGRLKRSKTPIVSKGKVGHLHTATIAEVLYTDTFDSGDHRFPYGQAFVDHASRWGDIIPLRSRKEIGSAFVTFVCRHYTPLILVSDNIAENKGGSLVEECRLRDVRQAYTCPHHPQQDRAEGYLGRITAMASFGIIYRQKRYLKCHFV